MRLSVLLAAITLAAPVAHAETTINTGVALEFHIDPNGAGTGNVTDLSAYGEVEFGQVYLGLAALKSSDDATDELALSLGHRGEMGALAYDLGYTHYAYPNDSASDYGEVVLGFEADLGDRLTATFDLGHDVTNSAGNAYLGAEYAATDALALSANFGLYEVPGAGSETEWDIGATWAFNDQTALDLRWQDGSDYADGYLSLSLAFDSSITR